MFWQRSLMIKKVPFSNLHLSIREIWEWFEFSQKASDEYKLKIRELLLSASAVPIEFHGMSLSEVNELFDRHRKESENILCLNLLVSVEAVLRIEYLQRVYKKNKDPLSRSFRDLYREKENRVRLDEDILRLWKHHHPELKG